MREIRALFILLGFSEYPHLQAPLFLVFLTIYTVTLVGNLGIIVVIRTNPKLHTPMYFFLSQDLSSQLQIPISISPKPKPDMASGILSSCLHSPHKFNQSVGSSSVVLVCFPLPAPISTPLVQVRLFNPANIYWLLRVPSTGLGTVNMKMNKIWFLSQKSLKFSTRLESKDYLNPHTYGQLIFHKGGKNIQ